VKMDIHSPALGLDSPAAIELAVARSGEGWRIFGGDGGWGAFQFRVDAEEAALRLATKLRGEGFQVTVLVQDAGGELQALTE
jgi:hypothetical protein